jgi:hypothetical protein
MKKTNKLLIVIGLVVLMASSTYGSIFNHNVKGYFKYDEGTLCKTKEDSQLAYEYYLTIKFDGRDKPVMLTSEYVATGVAHADRNLITNGVVSVSRSNCKLYIEGYLYNVENHEDAVVMRAEDYDYKIRHDYVVGNKTLNYALINLITPDGELVINDESPYDFYSKFDNYVANRKEVVVTKVTPEPMTDKEVMVTFREELPSDMKKVLDESLANADKYFKKNKGKTMSYLELKKLLKRDQITSSTDYTADKVGILVEDVVCEVSDSTKLLSGYILICKPEGTRGIMFGTKNIDDIADYEIGSTYKISGEIYTSIYVEDEDTTFTTLLISNVKKKKSWWKF